MPDYREDRKNEFRRSMVEGGRGSTRRAQRRAGYDSNDGYDEEYDSEDRVQELERRQRTRRRWRLRFVIAAVSIAALVIAGGWLFIQRFRYTTYEESSSRQLGGGSYVGMVGYGDNAIKYSHDGARYITASGTDIWADSYEMKAPGIYVSGDYACIYASGENKINIYNASGRIGSAETLLPITKAVISSNGVVAALIEDASASYITFFGQDGNAIDITIKSLIAGDGYPTDIALSPGGTGLMAAYEYLDGLEFKARVVFYDFSEIGKSIPNRLVGGFEGPFESSFISRVRYINATYSYAAGDTGIYFFSSKNLASPELVREVVIDEEILSIFNYKNHVGVITASSEEGGTHRLTLYKQDGTVALSRLYSFDHKYVSTDGSYIYLYGSNSLMIMTMRGVIKYDGEFRGEPKYAVRGTVPGVFIMTSPTEISEYKFK